MSFRVIPLLFLQNETKNQKNTTAPYRCFDASQRTLHRQSLTQHLSVQKLTKGAEIFEFTEFLYLVTSDKGIASNGNVNKAKVTR